jgi:hypothetical protein
MHGPAQANTAGTKKESVQGEEIGFGGEDKAQHAHGRCWGVGRDMGQVDFKFGARRQPVSQTGRRKVVVAKREKERD